MATRSHKDEVLMVLDAFMRHIRDGEVTVDNLCISVESEATGTQNGWVIHSVTGHRVLTVIFDVPRKEKG